jgi:hypothetical protein
MLSRDRLVNGSRIVVKIAFIANRIFLSACVVGFFCTWIFSTQFVALITQQNPVTDIHSAITGMRLLILIGITMSVATDRLLVALAQIVTTVGEGDPFIRANARRLQTIGWCLLVLQLTDFPALMLDKFFPSMGSAAPDVQFSVGGWISVLMVFVLSRVFAAGSAMRDDLEGTV